MINVADFSRFFVEKVDKVRRSTQDAPAPVFFEVKSGAELSSFETVTADKTSVTDPLPKSILKLVIDVIASFIAELFSLATGQFLRVFKDAFITLVIKKPGLNVANPGSNQPILNLAAMCKLLE